MIKSSTFLLVTVFLAVSCSPPAPPVHLLYKDTRYEGPIPGISTSRFCDNHQLVFEPRSIKKGLVVEVCHQDSVHHFWFAPHPGRSTLNLSYYPEGELDFSGSPKTRLQISYTCSSGTSMSGNDTTTKELSFSNSEPGNHLYSSLSFTGQTGHFPCPIIDRRAWKSSHEEGNRDPDSYFVVCIDDDVKPQKETGIDSVAKKATTPRHRETGHEHATGVRSRP